MKEEDALFMREQAFVQGQTIFLFSITTLLPMVN